MWLGCCLWTRRRGSWRRGRARCGRCWRAGVGWSGWACRWRRWRGGVLAAAGGAMWGGGVGTLIEVSPHPVLTVPVEEAVERAGVEGVSVLGSLRRQDGDGDRFVRALAEAHVAGVDVDWSR